MNPFRTLRTRTVLVMLLILGSAGLALLEARPAGADGLDVLCGAFDPVDVDDKQVTSVPGARITVDSTAPDGTEISKVQSILPFGLVPSPDTGGPNFGDAMRAVDIDTVPGIDLSFGWAFRLSTARGVGSAQLLGDNPIDKLFNENFRLPDDFRNPFGLPRPYVSGVGADIYWDKATGTTANQHKVELGGIVDFINRDGSRTHLKVRIGLDGRPGHSPGLDPRLPDRADISLLAKRHNDPTTALDDTTGGTLYLGVGLEFSYDGLVAESNPPLGLAVEAEIVDDAGNPLPDADFIDLELGLSRAPGDLAIGLRQRCSADRESSLSHLSLNRVAADPSTTLDVDLHSLAGSGLPTVPGGPAGDVVAVDGTFSGLPERLDVTMQPETIGVTRSPDVAPVLGLDRLLFAPDDPATTTESPIFVSGTVQGIPQHVRFRDRTSAAGGDRIIGVQGADITCGSPPPGGLDPALPIFPPDCAVGADAVVKDLQFVVQNFAPEDTDAMVAVTEFISQPLGCPDRQGFEVGYRQDLRSETGGLWRAAGCAREVRNAGVQMPRNPTYKPRITPWMWRSAPSDIDATVGAVLRNGEEERIVVELAGRVVAAPADLDMSFQSTVRTTFVFVGGRVEVQSRNIFDLVLPPGLTVDLKRIHVASGLVEEPPETLIFGTGSVTALPPHLRVETDTITSPSGVRLLSATAEACPTRPYGDPFVPSGNICNAYGLPDEQQAVGDINFEVQNFAPGDLTAADVPSLFPSLSEVAFAGNWATIAYRGPRDDRPTGHFAADVKIAGVRRVFFDLSATGDPAEVLSRRTLVNASVDLAAPLSRLLVKTHVDGRSSTSAASGEGFLVAGSGVLTPVPTHVDATFESRDYALSLFEDTPFSLEWHASAPIAVTWPYASLGRPNPENVFVQGPAPDLLTISGNVEIGDAGGAGGIAPDGKVAMTKAQDVVTRNEITYAASAPTVGRAGAVISTAADRVPAGTVNDLRTRVRAEVTVPAVPFEDPLVVNWTEASGAIREIGAYMCAENEGCPGNRVTATLHRGRTLADDSRTDLAPTVPGPQSMGGAAPIFSSFQSGPDGFAEGVRAVARTDGTVAGHLAVADIASVSAVLVPATTVRVRADSPPVFDCRPNPGGWPPIICTVVPDPFTINVFAQPSASAVPVFVNGALNDLPDDLVGRFRATDGDTTDPEPWIWLNTESVDIDSPPDLTEVGGETGGAQFDGRVLVGNQTRIAPSAFERAFTATEAPGVKARASITTSSSGSTTLGFGATVRLRLPRHVEIWKPTLRSCGAGTTTLSTCADREAYEAEVRTRTDIKVRTTADSLGFLKGRFEIDNGDQDYQGNISLDSIPGSLDARAEMIQNKRLPWTTMNLAYTANVSPGDARVTIYDRCLPAYKGDVVNSPPLAQYILPGRCITTQSPWNKVPNYDVTLRDIPAALDFTARVAASETPVLGVPREHLACPKSGYPGRGPTRLGYIHADLGFGSEMDDRDDDGRFDIDVDVRTGRTGQDADPASHASDTENSQAKATLSAEGELHGSIAAKVLNVGQEQAAVTSELWGDYLFTACVDFDLPIQLTFEDVRDLRMSLSGAKLGIFRNDSARVEGKIGESFICTTWQAPFGCGLLQFRRPITRSGAPYARHEVSFTGLGVNLTESGRKWKGMGLIDVTDRQPNDACTSAPGNCFVEAPADRFDTDDLDTDDAAIRRPDGTCCWEGLSSVMLLDPIWTTARRTSGALGLGEFYNTMNGLFALDLPADIPTVTANQDIDSLEGSFSYVGGFTTDDADERAVGSDGTRYMMYYRLVSPGGDGGVGASWQPELWAVHPGSNRGIQDQVRWIRPVGWHVGSNIIGRGSHDVSVTPHADGSVSVVLDFSGTAEDNAARFDASGNGRVLTGRTTVPVTAASGTVNGIVVLILPVDSELARTPSNGNTRRWYLGDGRTTGHVVNGGSIVRYTAPGTYYVLGIDYDAQGREVAQHAFAVSVSPPEM